MAHGPDPQIKAFSAKLFEVHMAKFSFQNSATLHNQLYRAKMRINRYKTGSDKRTGLTGYKIPGLIIYPAPHLTRPIT